VAFGVADHGLVDDVGEVSFEDTHRFFLGVAASAGRVIDLAGAGFTAQLGDGHEVQHGVDASVPTAVQAVAARFAVTFGGGHRDRRGAVEPGEAAFGEPARVTGLD